MNASTKKGIYISGAVLLVVAALLVRCSCNQEGTSQTIKEKKSVHASTEKSLLNPFSSSFNIPYQEYEFYTGRDTVYTYLSGTKIFIPSCAFAGETRSKEKVKITYREIADRTGIVATGIPMEMKQGSDGVLETTGMMEIRAEKDGKALVLDNGCLIRLDMVNTQEGKDVNLYYLDEKQKAWQLIQEDLPAKVKREKPTQRKRFQEPDYDKMAKEAAYFVPTKPRVADPHRFGFHFKINLMKYPEINVYDGIIWEYAGSGGADDPKKSPWVEKTAWKEMVLDKTNRQGIYTLRLYGSDKNFTTVVRPVFDKEDMEYAQDIFNDRYNQYRRFVEKKKEEHRLWIKQQEEIAKEKERQQVVATSGSVISRSFEINKMGIWNCDIFWKSENPVIVDLDFTFTIPDETAEKLYLVDKEKNSVVYYSAEKNAIKNFRFERGNNYEVIVIGSQGKVHKASAEELKRIEATSQTNAKMRINDEGVLVKSLEDLKMVVG